jgi:membrane-associated protease RseP (regulator of RpoE activity)
MKRSKWSWDAMLMASVVAMAGICAQSQQFAFAAEEELEGPIVQIGPSSGDETVAPISSAESAAPAEPVFWIGLRGRSVEDAVLRTQLQLAEGTGIAIEDIVPDSPAEKAGLRKHDIILRANDDMVDSMETLQQHVQTFKDKPIELEILRLGKEETVTVTPAERPEDFEQLAGPEVGIPGAGVFGGDLGRLLEQLQGAAGRPGGMRMFGPGMVLNGRQMNMNLNALPNGMSVSVTREGDGPAQITVTKGEQTWTVTSDDAKALAELPEDVRKVVSGMLDNPMGAIQQQLGQQQLGNLDWQAELKHMLPDRLGNLPGMGDIQAKEDAMAKRMEQMEKQLQELQERLEAEKAAN